MYRYAVIRGVLNNLQSHCCHIVHVSTRYFLVVSPRLKVYSYNLMVFGDMHACHSAKAQDACLALFWEVFYHRDSFAVISRAERARLSVNYLEYNLWCLDRSYEQKNCWRPAPTLQLQIWLTNVRGFSPRVQLYVPHLHTTIIKTITSISIDYQIDVKCLRTCETTYDPT